MRAYLTSTARRSTQSREAVKELEKAGYIVRSRERDEKGRLRGADYVIYEQPQLPTSDFTHIGKSNIGIIQRWKKPTQKKPTLKNSTQLNKDISSKEQSITDLSGTIPFPNPFAL